jgi:hypothetical protein
MKVYDRMFQFRLINSPLSPGTEKVSLTVELGSADDSTGSLSLSTNDQSPRTHDPLRVSGTLYITPCNHHDSCYARCISSHD